MTTKSVFIRRVEHLLDLLRNACLAAASLALVTLVVTFGWLVFGRYVLNATPTWVEQLALLLICYIAFLGAAAGVRDNTHIGVSLFRDMMPPTVQKLLLILIDIALGFFGAVMLFAGLTLMSFGWDTLLPMLHIPETVRTAAITSLGALTMLFAGTRALLRIAQFDTWTPHTENEEF